jgi:hypothetical protein
LTGCFCILVFKNVALTLAQVNDKDGEAIAKVRVGDTKIKALNRLSQVHGLLVDKYGVGLADDDLITAEDAPYTFTPVSQQPQPHGKLRCCVVVLYSIRIYSLFFSKVLLCNT